MQNRKRIAYISGTRADFGLMTPVLNAIEKSEKLSLQVYATGMHLMPEFGETIHEVEKIFSAVRRIEAVFKTDDREGPAAFSGALFPKVASLFTKERPDFVLLLGDRVEMLVIAVACLYLGIPTGHLHGGERTATVDEMARHAISKLSSLHFPATEESAKRLKKLGEDVWRIYMVGAPALDTILHEKLLSRGKMHQKLGLDPLRKYILLIQHAVSEKPEDAGVQMAATIAAIKSFGLPVVVLYPNADPGGRRIIAEIEKERGNPLFHIFPSIPHLEFLALERDAAVWVGNSSAALIESSSFGVPVVNVGTRQKERVRGANIIDTGYEKAEIEAAIKRSLYDQMYRIGLRRAKNPWGDGKTARRIIRILERLPSHEKLLAKQIAY